ncbi:phage integrase [Sphingopyxis fribergensis]|uniref:Phage integrase n=1 Tax=Sphingopyxis fribergensis TaxID=1515612 RepID=A0A0A7PEK9_9SPHN|nr:phage integrase [Sphingopyxis fribergensis]
MNELIQIDPISPLRQRLIDEMTMRRCSKETQRNYLREVGRFATWLRRSPHTASAENVRQFQIEQQQAGVPAPTMNSIVGALRFFFTHTLDRPDLARKLIRTKHARKIPVVLTMADVKRLLDATRSLKHQAALSVAYGAEVAAIAYYNKPLVYDPLFKAAADTMLTIAADPRHLGARIGITAVLHTWGSALTHQPHAPPRPALSSGMQAP